MNKVFKVIWSKTKNCYVVASEFAKSHTKSPSAKGLSKTLVCGVLACVLGFGIVMPVFADASYEAGGGVADGEDSVAIGNNAYAGGDYSVAIGTNADAEADNATAIGNFAVAAGNSSVAIGDFSIATQAGTVSFGLTEAELEFIQDLGFNPDLNDFVYYEDSFLGQNYYGRRLTNVAPAQSASDAVTLGQLAEIFDSLGIDLDNQGSSGNNGPGLELRAGNNVTINDLGTNPEGQTILSISATPVVQGLGINGLEGSDINFSGGGASGTNSITLGGGAVANSSGSLSLGYNAKAQAEDSVALGSDSVANIPNVVSVGTPSNPRRIMNVANGILDNDVVTVGQLNAVTANLGNSVPFAPGVGIANISQNATNYDGSGAIGYDSIAIGDAKAAGAGSVAVGSQALTTGANSIAIGTYATATGDGTTREEINSILANNKAIRDTLNDARADYTSSQAEYNRQREIWEGQNEAVARVNHANELIAGYQSEIANTLQPNADIANNNYQQAKSEYDTLYNNLNERLSYISSIDFSLYANTSTGVVDRDAIAAALKTHTEEGTPFNYPQSFYRSYVDNYIKVEGDMRQNAQTYEDYVKASSTGSGAFTANFNLASSSTSNNPASNYNYFSSMATMGNYGLLTITPQNSSAMSLDAFGGFRDKITGDFDSWSEAYSNGDINAYTNQYNYYQLVNNFIPKNSIIIDLNNKTYSLPSDSSLDSASRSNFVGKLNSFKNSMKDRAVFPTMIDMTATLDSEAYDYMCGRVDQEVNNLKNFNYDNNTNYKEIVDMLTVMSEHGYISTSDFSKITNTLKLNDDYLDAYAEKTKKGYEYAREQYLYEYYRDQGNDSEALIHLGNKERILSEYVAIHAPENFQGSNQEALETIQQIQTTLFTPVAEWFLNDMYVPLHEKNVVLSMIHDNLDSLLTEKQQALQEATSAKNAADQALQNKQNQINNTQPSQADIAAANAAEASAQDLAQKEAKLQADEEALELAKANLQNLETISTDGESAIAIGGNAVTTGKNGIGIGTDALVTGEEAIGIGKNSIASGRQSIAIGTDNSVSSANSIVIGTNNGVTGTNSIAIGNNNVITGQNSVAIGNNLNVSEDNVVLLGTRRVTGVVDGQSATDAATVGQTFELVAGSNVSLEELGTNEIGQKKYKLSSSGGGGGTTYVSGDNIVIEDDVISAQGLIKYDGSDKATASLEGTRGTKLTNLKAASLLNGSTDAVIGHQLWQTNTNIEGFAQDIRTNSNSITNLSTSVTNALSSVSAISSTVDAINTTKADASLNNLTNAGRQVIATAAANAVQEYMAANGGNGGSLGNNLLGGTNILSTPRVMGFGLMANPTSSNDIVTNNDLLGDTNDISLEVQAALDEKANVSLDNINDSGIAVIRNAVADDLALKADKDSVYTKEESDSLLGVKADISYVDSALELKADKDTVYTKTETDDFLSKKADVSYVDAGLDTKADKNNVYTKEETNFYLDTKADKTDLNKKANVDGSNIDAEAWTNVLGTGQVAKGNTGLVNGGTVYNSLNNLVKANPIQVDDTAVRIAKQEYFDDVRVVDISNSKGEARIMTGVITNPDDASSAANVGYVNAVGQNIMGNINGQFAQMNNKISDVGANAAAMSALMPVGDDADKKWSLSASVGHYDSSTASAVGLFYKPSDNVIVNVRGTVGSDENMLAGGVSVALDKGSTPGVSKAQLVRTVNAQAEKIQSIEAERNNDKAVIAEQGNRIAQLEAAVRELAKEKAKK